MTEKTPPIRGYLLNITHYDPRWCAAKDTEQPFNLEFGLDVIDEMARAGLNLLVVDCADAVQYSSHPELTRHYSVPMDVLVRLVERASKYNIEVVPKLNFAQSALHQHNHWFRPHNRLFDSQEYWKLAFEVIDELIEVVGSPRFFHVGMDEDHWRSYGQYVTAICSLHDRLEERGLRTIIWNDSACHWPEAEIHKEKSLAAEKAIPTDIVQVLWNYWWDVQQEAMQRIRNAGFELWAAPGNKPELVIRQRDALLECGGSGMLLTSWISGIEENRAKILSIIRTLGPLCGQA